MTREFYLIADTNEKIQNNSDSIIFLNTHSETYILCVYCNSLEYYWDTIDNVEPENIAWFAKEEILETSQFVLKEMLALNRACKTEKEIKEVEPEDYILLCNKEKEIVIYNKEIKLKKIEF